VFLEYSSLNTRIQKQEEFEDTNRVTRIRKSKKNRKHNDQKKCTKGQTTIYKTYA